jgi:L-ascorbate metabolism protein UlaG (beta-lactamase superfamily)
MDIQDALACALLLDVKTVIGMHYDTFGYIVIAKDAAVELFAQNGIELILMEIGSNKEI